MRVAWRVGKRTDQGNETDQSGNVKERINHAKPDRCLMDVPTGPGWTLPGVGRERVRCGDGHHHRVFAALAIAICAIIVTKVTAKTNSINLNN